MSMRSRTIRKILSDSRKLYQDYLNRFHRNERPIYFEKLIADVFSRILYLPFYHSDNEDTNITHRVVWLGRINPLSNASGNRPDAIAYCYNYCFIIEATLKTGTNQRAREFAQSTRHYDNFCNQNINQCNNVYIILIVKKLHQDTYTAIKSSPQYKFIPLTIYELMKILDTSIMAFTFHHYQLQELFHRITGCIRDSLSKENFDELMNKNISEWQMSVLEMEKSSYTGVKSYFAMQKIGRNNIGTSEILEKLLKHKYVSRYFKTLRNKPTLKDIEKGLEKHDLARLLIRIPTNDEAIYMTVPYKDFEASSKRLIKVVKGIK